MNFETNKINPALLPQLLLSAPENKMCMCVRASENAGADADWDLYIFLEKTGEICVLF
jgi:hypothetical protein